MTVFETAQFLRERDNFLILTHVRPDGDTVGCAAGLCRALRALGKTACVLPNPETSDLFSNYLEGLTCEAGYAHDTVVCVDMAARSMFPDNAVQYMECVDLTIDHHPSQEFYAKHTCLDASCAACGEIVYEIAALLGEVTADIAQPLYVAVSTDCGCFAYGNTSANTHAVAAKLIETGIDLAYLNKRHFRTKSFIRVKLESAILNDMELHENGEVAVAAIPLSLMDCLGATKRDIEDIAALVGAVEGVKVSATIRELGANSCKLSLRSDPNYLNASTVCATFSGGGHAAAAGATLELPLEETKAAVLGAIRKVKYGS